MISERTRCLPREASIGLPGSRSGRYGPALCTGAIVVRGATFRGNLPGRQLYRTRRSLSVVAPYPRTVNFQRTKGRYEHRCDSPYVQRNALALNWSDIIICIRDRCETVLVLDPQGAPNQRVQLQPDTGNEVCSWVYARTVTSITSFAVTVGVFLRSSPACTPVLLVWDIVHSCS